MNLPRAFMACLAAALPLTALTLRADPPPLLPDWETAQLYEGCAIQVDSYARRLKALDPAWDVQMATLPMPSGATHSVALVSRDGERYLRDSVLGVFPVTSDDLATLFRRRLRQWRSEHPLTTPNAPGNHFAPQTEAATAAVADIVQKALGTESERFLVIDGKQRFWVVAWTTINGERALYHPRIGTTLTGAKGTRDGVAVAVLRALGCKHPVLIGSSQR